MRVKYSGFLSSSYQRVMLQALNDPDLTWFPSIDGSSITRSALLFGATSIVFEDSNLAQAGNGSVSGTVTGFTFSNVGDPTVDATGTNMHIDLAQLTAAAEAVTGGFGSAEYINFLDVLMAPNNRIIGTAHRDVLESGPGNDTLAGRGGNDVFVFHPDFGSPAAAAAAAAPTVKVDVIKGGYGVRDILLIEHPDGAPHTDSLGLQKYSIFIGAKGVINDNDNLAQAIAKLDGIEDVRGSRAGESIYGSSVGNRLWGAGGDDEIFGRGGDDHLFGGRGFDQMSGGAGRDVLNGGPGRDILDGGVGNDTLTGGRGPDLFYFDTRPNAHYQGHDTIADFDAAHDRVHLFGAVHADIQVSVSNGNTVIDYGNGIITLTGVQLAESDITFLF